MSLTINDQELGHINGPVLPKHANTKIERIKLKRLNYSNFEFNNFKKVSNNETINEIENKDGAIWINTLGDICIRRKKDSAHKPYTITKAAIILNTFLSKPIKIEVNKSLEQVKGAKDTIHVSELLLVEDERFNPRILEEFYEQNGEYYLNTFKPSKYLLLDQKEYKLPKATLDLMFHLVNGDNERFQYFVNWLACFFQTLQKSQVAILLKGVQGSGKGTFFKVVQQLFGEAYCKEINGDTLKSNYLGSFIENTLFLNFDEISYKSIGKSSFSSFLKAIITNDFVTAEKKNLNMEKAIQLHAQTILFSNVDKPIEIEQSDRRFTVFTTGCNLTQTNFLGYGSFNRFEQAITDELSDFAIYLKQYQVNADQANFPLWTNEKASMIDATDNNLQTFIWAIKTQQIPYFENLRAINYVIHNEFIHSILNRVVKQKYLIIAYRALFPDDQRIRSSKSLLTHLETLDPAVFGNHNLFKSNGDKYYHLF